MKSLQLFEYIIDTGFDHLIISGDLTENTERSAFELTRETLKKFGLLNSGKLSMVIGNHDIFGGVHLAEDVINFPKKCKITNYQNKVSEFNYYFSETFERTERVNGNSYPFVKAFDDVVLIGLNTIAEYSLLKNPFA
jgi:3',5'-cyclic AMP phosphodiesterase CpdA